MQVIRRAIRLTGVVQGVGMRPHIARVAARHEVSGSCRNTSSDVTVTLEGSPKAVHGAIEEIIHQAPPLAQILGVEHHEEKPTGETTFTIITSTADSSTRTFLPPDVATCEDCLRDMADPHNRRYRYPFTTCTNCGPRLSIITDVPYDRPNTTMAHFALCPDCAREYHDPTDRRYHAQPISCPHCGPTLWIEYPDGTRCEYNPIEIARQELRAGKILALKGIGGFHLLVDARDAAGITRLRERKHRPHKPFAVMVPDSTSAQEIVFFNAEELKLLESPARPIVIATSRGVLPEELAPGLKELGIMLPYAPLHTLVIEFPVVATSANYSGEPLCYTNDSARRQLGELADVFLMHDRPIATPVEDSVYVSTSLSRRSRGYAPTPIALKNPGAVVVAVGAELKNTIALAEGSYLHLSAHNGDMSSLASREAWATSVDNLLAARAVTPEIIACDMHPGYATTVLAEQLAERYDSELVAVQHHHAHALSLMLDSGREGPAVIAALDGTGYGLDGSIWGGEILIVDGPQWQRAWHLPTFPLVGGDRAVMEPWRSALGVAESFGISYKCEDSSFEAVRAVLASGIATSSTGRLFDAAAALIGVRTHVTYEAQAAMELEQLARTFSPDFSSEPQGGIPTPGGIPELMAAVAQEPEPARAAYLFHEGLAQILARQLRRLAAEVGVNWVGITGGSALNRLLVQRLRAALGPIKLITHQRLPANDGGLAAGQAIAGRLASS